MEPRVSRGRELKEIVARGLEAAVSKVKEQ